MKHNLHIFIVFKLGTKFLSFEPEGTEKSSKDYSFGRKNENLISTGSKMA